MLTDWQTFEREYLLPDWWQRMYDASPGLPCCADDGNGRRCTRQPGHTGRHLSCGTSHAYAVWSDQ